MDRIIALNESIAEELIFCGARPSQILRIPNGVSIEAFQPASMEQQAAARAVLIPSVGIRPVIGFVGRFVERKGLDLLIEALCNIPLHRRPYLLLVGDVDDTFGDGFDPKKTDLDDLIILSTRQDVHTAYHAMDAYVSASLAEGMSNACLEAMACGLPLILSDIPGHRELVQGNKGGWLFPSGNAAGLEKALLDFEANFRLGKAADKSRWVRRNVVRKYAAERIARRYAALYRELSAE